MEVNVHGVCLRFVMKWHINLKMGGLNSSVGDSSLGPCVAFHFFLYRR